MLIFSADKSPLIKELLSFLKGMAILFPAAGTWWILLLILLGIWKHVSKKISIPINAVGYDASYWSLVFSLGMCTVSTMRLAEALALTFLSVIPKYFIFFELLTWIAVSNGFIRQTFSSLIKKKSSVI